MTVLMDEGTELGNGRYVLQSRLGRGGAATVWLAEDTVLERPVAVKVLSEGLAADENWLARFGREARMAAGLSHPNLVSVYDFAADERPYIVMAHMPGGSLWDRLQEGDASDPEDLTHDLLSALVAIHSGGIIHRDIKPGNVLFDRDGTACLTDFGVARPEDATSLTQTGHIPGTARFMAPELWRGHPADERTDLYAAGILLRQAIGNDAPEQILDLIERLAAEEPADRPASAAAALAELGGAEPTPTAPLEPDDRTEAQTPRALVIQPKSRSHRRAAIAGLAVLAIVAVAAIAQAIGGGDDSPAGSAATSASSDSQNDNSGSGNGNGDSGSGSGGGSGPEKQVSNETPPAVDPVALDQEGRALIDAGDPEAAIPILQQAVDYYPEDSRDINYAYSLYNLGEALLLAGRPDEAIPYLEKRMTFDDGQLDTVQATLDEAYEAAGVSSGGGSEGKPEKVPPGQEKQDD